MTSLALPDTRRRFMRALWFSAALHAAVIGLTRLPPQQFASAPLELQVMLDKAAAPIMPKPEPETEPSSPVPASDFPVTPLQAPTQQPRLLVQAAPQPESLPGSRPPASAQDNAPVPAATSPALPAREPVLATRESSGSQINIPLAVDTRYYPVKELDAPPGTLRKPEPAYPPQAEEQGVPGSVLLRLHLEADGSISQTEVVTVSPGGVFGDMFRKSALDAIKSVKFRPARRNGLPVRALVEFRIVFEQGAD